MLLLYPPHLCRLSTATPAPRDEGPIIQRHRGRKDTEFAEQDDTAGDER